MLLLQRKVWLLQIQTKVDIYTLLSVEPVKDIVTEWVDYYEYLMSIGDKRVETWGLMYSPVPTIIITILYLLSKY